MTQAMCGMSLKNHTCKKNTNPLDGAGLHTLDISWRILLSGVTGFADNTIELELPDKDDCFGNQVRGGNLEASPDLAATMECSTQ